MLGKNAFRRQKQFKLFKVCSRQRSMPSFILHVPTISGCLHSVPINRQDLGDHITYGEPILSILISCSNISANYNFYARKFLYAIRPPDVLEKSYFLHFRFFCIMRIVLGPGHALPGRHSRGLLGRRQMLEGIQQLPVHLDPGRAYDRSPLCK